MRPSILVYRRGIQSKYPFLLIPLQLKPFISHRKSKLDGFAGEFSAVAIDINGNDIRPASIGCRMVPSPPGIKALLTIAHLQTAILALCSQRGYFFLKPLKARCVS